MRNNYKILVKIEISKSEEEVSEEIKRIGVGEYERIMSEEEARSIDKSEEYLVALSYKTMREAYGAHLGEMSEEYRKEVGVEEEKRILKKYRVDSEVGRVEFEASYWVEGKGKGEKLRGLYEVQGGREWYRTVGWKEIALEQGVVNESYRKAGAMLNRVRHQEEKEGTPVRSLCEHAQAEGEQVLSYLEKRSEEILKAHHFNAEGIPVAGSGFSEEGSKEREGIGQSPETRVVAQAIRAVAPNPEWEIEMRENPIPYENLKGTVQISVDDVGAKHQTEQRAHYKPAIEELAYAHTTVAHIQYQDASYSLGGKSLASLLRFVLAFLLHNQLLSFNLIFFLDGQRSLYSAILAAFAWFPSVQIILDWFHLDKRCRESLSLALKGRDIRNEFLEQLLQALWHGCTDRAILLLDTLDDNLIKNHQALFTLIDYLERNRPFIPAYSVRKRLALRNGSNRGEKANDLLVSTRQKHKGMSWSFSGSSALAALAALVANAESHLWFRSSSLSFALITNS